jgi:hypothetical protein
MVTKNEYKEIDEDLKRGNEGDRCHPLTIGFLYEL